MTLASFDDKESVSFTMGGVCVCAPTLTPMASSSITPMVKETPTLLAPPDYAFEVTLGVLLFVAIGVVIAACVIGYKIRPATPRLLPGV
jgi:hypothetical protein